MKNLKNLDRFVVECPMSYPLKKILASLPPGPRPPIFIGVVEPLVAGYWIGTPANAGLMYDVLISYIFDVHDVLGINL